MVKVGDMITSNYREGRIFYVEEIRNDDELWGRHVENNPTPFEQYFEPEYFIIRNTCGEFDTIGGCNKVESYKNKHTNGNM